MGLIVCLKIEEHMNNTCHILRTPHMFIKKIPKQLNKGNYFTLAGLYFSEVWAFSDELTHIPVGEGWTIPKVFEVEEVSSLTPGDPWEGRCRFHSGWMSEPALTLHCWRIRERTIHSKSLPFFEGPVWSAGQ